MIRFQIAGKRKTKDKGRYLILWNHMAPANWVVKRMDDLGTLPYQGMIEELSSGYIVHFKNVPFRVLAEFKLARSRGDFKEIGVT